MVEITDSTIHLLGFTFPFHGTEIIETHAGKQCVFTEYAISRQISSFSDLKFYSRHIFMCLHNSYTNTFRKQSYERKEAENSEEI